MLVSGAVMINLFRRDLNLMQVSLDTAQMPHGAYLILVRLEFWCFILDYQYHHGDTKSLSLWFGECQLFL